MPPVAKTTNRRLQGGKVKRQNLPGTGHADEGPAQPDPPSPATYAGERQFQDLAYFMVWHVRTLFGGLNRSGQSLGNTGSQLRFFFDPAFFRSVSARMVS